MRITRSLEFQIGSNEEKLPYATAAFPYIASRAELDDYREPFVPWHWHNAVELFYMESGVLRYHTPHETITFPAGTAGFVNSNVLHRTEIRTQSERNVQLLHIFGPKLLAGSHGSAIEQKYIMPVVASPQIELLALRPEVPEQAAVIERIRSAFRLSEDALGYEIRIRDALSQICISHAFMLQDIRTSIGTFDVSDDDYRFMARFVRDAVYDDYDRLVQLCDALALPTGFCLLEKRFVDVARRCPRFSSRATP